jgi:ubiquinone/menaquinone biosynthesis C-methylase UbiE
MQGMVAPLSSVGRPVGTGGFFDPENIVDQFGVQPGMQIADFGCGSGYFTVALAQRTGPDGRVFALDVREEALDLVNAKSRQNGLENIEAIRTNLEVLGSSKLSDESQDIVLMANVLFQSQNHESILIEGYRVLKNGGLMIIIDWKKGNGGFGPPDEFRLDPDKIQNIAEKIGVSLDKKIDAGQFHFGLILKK